MDREALATKERFRRSGARAGTADGLTWGDLASPLKGGRRVPESTRRSEKSAAAVVAEGFG
jgi:hypothetical protein